jgi:glucokinase
MRAGLVADIGGTNARFALVDLDAPTPRLHAMKALRGSDYASLHEACAHYLSDMHAVPAHAAFAIASPLKGGDEVRMTNRAWSFRRSALEHELGLERLCVLNDFGAVAHAIPALGVDDVVHLFGAASLPPAAPVTVMGPGTGLGVALLLGDASCGWQVVETEGGHATFAPIGAEERRIADRFDAWYGRTSNERVLCGEGLARIDAVLRDVDATALRDPAEIVRLATEGTDDAARRALARFCAILGSVCGDVALIHGAHALMIAGGIVPRFVPFLRASAFRERFLAKGRFAAYVEKVAIHVVTHPQPGLLGAAVALRESLEHTP